MTKIFASIVILVVLLAVGGAYAVRAWNRIVFKFAFKGLDFSTINFQSLVATGQTSAKLLLVVNIRNDNPFSIPFNKMKIWLNYENTLIAESSGILYAKSFVLPPNGGVVDVDDYVNVYLNKASGNLLNEVRKKSNPKVEYTVKISVFRIKLTYTDFFVATV